MTVGREWYMHTIYTVKATDARKRRSIVHTYHSMVRSGAHRSRSRRAVEPDLTDTIGQQHDRGTQMMHIKLDIDEEEEISDQGQSSGGVVESSGNQSGSSESFPLLAVIIGVAALLVVVVIVAGILLYKRRQPAAAAVAAKDDKAKGKYTGGKHIVVRKRGSKTRNVVMSQTSNSSGYSSSDGSEV